MPRTADGQIYNTDFVHVVTIAHGKVERFREFFDTFAAAEAFKPDPGPASWRPRRAVALLIVFALAFLSFFEFVQPWYTRWGATDEEVIASSAGRLDRPDRRVRADPRDHDPYAG